MEKKVSERTNVLTETENKSFIHAVINAVTKGYSDNTVLEDILDLVRRKEVSKGVLQAAPEALKTYGEAFKNSLQFLADSIDDLEVIDEPTVRKKEKPLQENVVEEEMKKVEEEGIEDEPEEVEEVTTEKSASFEKFTTFKVSEDWDAYYYDEKANVMTGLLKLNFGHDMSKFVANNKVVLDKNDVNSILSRIYGYFTTEFKNLKANLDKEIFKSDIRFSSLNDGIASVEYEVKGAF